MEQEFKDMKGGTIFFVEGSGGGFALAKLYSPLPSRIKCHGCGNSTWNATNFKNTVHVCPERKHEITGYLIDENQERILHGNGAKRPKVIHVSGKRWFSNARGNTYCSANIWIDGNHVHYVKPIYGYDDMYLQLAFEWLDESDLLPEPREKYDWGGSEAPWRYCERMGIKLIYDVSDVTREKDL